MSRMDNKPEKNIELSTRVLQILEKYDSNINPIDGAYDLLKDILNPIPERYDMIYRYEHTMRVVEIGKRIANESMLDEEALVIACLLHDIGYPECKTIDELKEHPRISAEIASIFLTNIGYDTKKVYQICDAIRIHDYTDNIPKDVTSFELSVRDADDIDRYGIMRAIIKINSLIGENDKDTIVKNCERELEKVKKVKEYQRGTDIATNLMNKQIDIWIFMMESLIQQMKGP